MTISPSKTGGEDVLQLIYSSVCCLDDVGEPGEAGVTRIISQSFLNNMRRGITGILFHGDDYFLQLLEGSDEAILEAMDYIQKDRRHKNVRIIAKRSIEYYSLPYSPMACAGFTKTLPAQVRDAITASGGQRRSDVRANIVRDYLLSQAKRDDLDQRLQALQSTSFPPVANDEHSPKGVRRFKDLLSRVRRRFSAAG